MVKYSDNELDTLFGALSDRTRRHVLDELAEGGERGVTELATAHQMSLPGFMKHLRVLEDAGLIARTKEGRVVSCELSAAPMKEASVWMSRYEKFWTEKLDSLARYLYQQEEFQTWKKPAPGKNAASGKNPSSPSTRATPSRRRKSGGRGPTGKR
jgi:DNA-binding transcriptional ArsR family regulator